MTKSIKRSGKTLVVNPMTASRRNLVAVGFTPSEADAMVSMRRILPFDPESKTPKYDARKLWERIGKPHGRFNDWAEKHIKPLINITEKTVLIEVVTFQTPTGGRGKPRTDYLLSRDIAAGLAMQVRTPEGEKVRTYFLAMERAFFALQLHGEHRNLTAEDKVLHRFLLERADWDSQQALDWERDIKNRVAEVLSGYAASAWRSLLGCGQGIRDVLFTDDMALYDRAYATYIGIIQIPTQTFESAAEFLATMYGDSIKPSRYGLTPSPTEVIPDF